jgi:hypothetical protein
MKGPVRGYGRFLIVAIVAATVTGVGGSGCSAPRPVRSVKNPDPLGRIPAFKEAVREKDRRAVRYMVRDLDSDDPAVRLFAIVGLERLTGRTFDYRYYDDQHQRLPAIKRWQDWLEGKRQQQDDPTQDAAVAHDGAADAPSGAPDGASGP